MHLSVNRDLHNEREIDIFVSKFKDTNNNVHNFVVKVATFQLNGYFLRTPPSREHV